MAILRINAADGALDWDEGAARTVRAAPCGAAAVFLVHGWKYDPAGPAKSDPHQTLYNADAEAEPVRRARTAAWPPGLGFSAEGAEDGLCFAFAWRARGRFARAYLEASEAGARLAQAVGAVHAARPDLRIDVFAHSLGARVALAAFTALARAGDARALDALDRAILLGAAEFAYPAHRALAAAREAAGGRAGPDIYNFISRQNDLFDALFERFAPPAARRAGLGALGRAGLGGDEERWLDLQFDHPGLAAWLDARGCRLAAERRAACHWSFYTRDGAMALYRAILRERADWSQGALRSAGAPTTLEPRWATLAGLVPRLGGARTA